MLLELDTQLLLAWQNLLDSSFADTVVPYLRNKETWFPAYVLIIIALVRYHGVKGWYYVIGAILALSLSDILNSHLLKEWIARPRPCQVAELVGQLKVLVRCSPHFSMPSSHASNHFALSAFLVLSGAITNVKWKAVLWCWATIIGLAQVYVGVHYPGDIVAGAILGIVLGFLLSSGLKAFWLKRMNQQ